MIGSTAVEVAIGLILVFFVFSLLASGMSEAIAGLLRMRARFLAKGIRKLVDDTPVAKEDPDPGAIRVRPTPDQLSAALANSNLTPWLYKHPIIDDLRSPGWKDRRRDPSYLPARSFARALIDVLVPDATGADALDRLRASLDDLPDVTGLKRPLLALVDEANGSVDRFRSVVEGWFDDHMDRVAGWYKGWARRVLLALGLVVAVAFNVDTVAVARDLWDDAPVRAAVVAQASEAKDCDKEQSQSDCARERIADLGELRLPIGWSGVDADDAGDWALRALGWAITAGALSFGAPFWFNLLGKAGSLRAAGDRPAKSGEPS